MNKINKKYFDEYDLKIIFKQLIDGLEFIHAKNFLHRDLKLQNILIDNYVNNIFNIKIYFK